MNEKIPLSQKLSLFGILVGAVSAGIVFLLTFVIFGLGLDIFGYLLFIILGALAAFLSQKIKYSYGVINAIFSGILAVLILFVGCFLIHSYFICNVCSIGHRFKSDYHIFYGHWWNCWDLH
ncbi:MAG: hypothetical protein Q7U35_00785 [Methanobacteriaceae archaeon]|nr:hypothetical protein [Methanobacteriaceae archaeon]MDP2837227.1 hypothetical protein [Methanobacteriaceae archaeon]MDP3623720.1 hypothetical protein [Methanobacteriaceae archaeon]